MTLDRSKAPDFRVPEDFELFPPTELLLKNGAKLFFIPTPDLAAVKIEVLGKGNRAFLPLVETLVPSFTLQMLQEGTTSKTSEEIANFFDFHASEVSPLLTYSHEGLSLLTTKKHLEEVIPVFLSLFTDSIFPQEYLEKKQSQRKLSIRLEKEKTASKASQLFRKALFGPGHPYGLESEEKHVDSVTKEKLKSYYSEMLWQDLEVFVSGDFEGNELENMCESLGVLPNRTRVEESELPATDTIYQVIESRENAVQSSIRIGNWSISKTDPDFFALSVFNTILGGYFGSRLIKNIREDKGHTYGISSSLAEIGDSNYWVIGADVQKAFSQEVIAEIYHEIEKLVSEPIDEDELEVVRNYMIGQMLSRFSSSYDLMDRFRSVHHSGLDFNFYTKKLAFLKSFSAEEVTRVGEKYFKERPLIEVVVG
ncbi:MAG: pitrilysin family protein [Algoriphagus sp.]|nr:pitrilysin family protein [Algoriphagus sp.]